MAMNSNPVILTVIITTYNQKESIARALDSVVEQETTYPYDIWLCDDCSTDETLSVCKNYVERYPEKIKLFPQLVNTYSDPTREYHMHTAIKNVNTKYWCLLNGDDEWCDSQKIQIALDFLESNPEYITFAHDTMYNDITDKTKKSLVHEIHRAEIQNPVTFESAVYLHGSSRIYRNVIRFSEGKDIRGDIYLFYNYLDKGPLYFYDKVMSVYNINGMGVWSSLSDAARERLLAIDNYQLNRQFRYKYDEFFTKRAGYPKILVRLKKIFGKQLSWKLWLFLKNREWPK
jgi:glycosyltransferase involved in cell wall biosynthesis